MMKQIVQKEKLGLLWLVVLFLFVYDCYFYGLNLTSNLYLAMMGIPTLILYLLMKRKFVLRKNDIYIIFSLFLLLFWSFFVILINNSTDYSFIENEILRNIVFPFFAAFIVALIGKNFIKSVDHLFKSFVIISSFQSVIIISSFFISNIKKFVMSIQFIGEREMNILNVGIRSLGIGTRFDYGAFTMSIVLLMIVYLYSIEEKKSRKNLYIVLFGLNSAAGMLLARSIFVGVVLAIVYLIIANNNFNIKLGFIFKFGMLISLVVFIIFIFFPDFVEKNINTINWIFQYFYDSSSSLNSNDTVKTLFGKMYFFPSDFKTFLIGDGIFTDSTGVPYFNTDPLYMRYLLYGGLPCLILFVTYLNFWIKKIKKIFMVNSKNKKSMRKILLFWVFFFIFCLTVYVKLNYHFFKVIYLVNWLLIFYYNDSYENVRNLDLQGECKNYD